MSSLLTSGTREELTNEIECVRQMLDSWKSEIESIEHIVDGLDKLVDKAIDEGVKKSLKDIRDQHAE